MRICRKERIKSGIRQGVKEFEGGEFLILADLYQRSADVKEVACERRGKCDAAPRDGRSRDQRRCAGAEARVGTVQCSGQGEATTESNSEVFHSEQRIKLVKW